MTQVSVSGVTNFRARLLGVDSNRLALFLIGPGAIGIHREADVSVAVTGSDNSVGNIGSSAGVCIISGGSRGLGQVLTSRLLALGWQIATCSRHSNEYVEQTLERLPDRFVWQSVDATDATAVRAFVRSCAARFGQLDLLVNNSGSLHTELLMTAAPARVRSVIDNNLVAPILFTQACARIMIPQRSGAIVNISSVSAARGYRGVSAYAAAKAGIEGFSRSAARELGAFNIRVNTVVPGFFDSDMTSVVGDLNREKIQRRTPLGRLGDIQEVADAVLFLASERASFVTGQSMVVDGGITC